MKQTKPFKDSILNDLRVGLAPYYIFRGAVYELLVVQYKLAHEAIERKLGEMCEEFEARADYHYVHNKHFRKGLNRVDGRERLGMFFCHWATAWMDGKYRGDYLGLQKRFG